MLRIKTFAAPDRITLALEGDLTGVWVCEFFHAWRDACRSLETRALFVDLTAVTRVDQAGQYLLALIHCNGSKLSGSGLVISNLLETIASDWPMADATNTTEVPTGR